MKVWVILREFSLLLFRLFFLKAKRNWRSFFCTCYHHSYLMDLLCSKLCLTKGFHELTNVMELWIPFYEVSTMISNTTSGPSAITLYLLWTFVPKVWRFPCAFQHSSKKKSCSCAASGACTVQSEPLRSD